MGGALAKWCQGGTCCGGTFARLESPGIKIFKIHYVMCEVFSASSFLHLSFLQYEYFGVVCLSMCQMTKT